MPQDLQGQIVRVSFRESKEDSYRALRQAGYSWGVAQVAGRCAGVAQVLFGTGVTAVLKDSSRFAAGKRTAHHLSRADKVVISSRGMSWLTVGPIAVAAALSKSHPVVWVRGAKVGPELAAVIWDLKVSEGEAVVWGSRSKSGWDAFQVGQDGELCSCEISADRIGDTPLWATWFVCLGGGKPKEIVLSVVSRESLVSQAHREGVSVDQSEWHQLEKLARKFLVPE